MATRSTAWRLTLAASSRASQVVLPLPLLRQSRLRAPNRNRRHSQFQTLPSRRFRPNRQLSSHLLQHRHRHQSHQSHHRLNPSRMRCLHPARRHLSFVRRSSFLKKRKPKGRLGESSAVFPSPRPPPLRPRPPMCPLSMFQLPPGPSHVRFTRPFGESPRPSSSRLRSLSPK